MEFILENYIWFSVGAGVMIMTLIGYLAEKTDFGKKKFEAMAAKKEKEELDRQSKIQNKDYTEEQIVLTTEVEETITDEVLDEEPKPEAVSKKLTRLEKIKLKKQALQEEKDAKELAKKGVSLIVDEISADSDLPNEIVDEELIQINEEKETLETDEIQENIETVDNNEEVLDNDKESENQIVDIEVIKDETEAIPIEITEEQVSPSYEIPEINIDEIESVKEEVVEINPTENNEEVFASSYEIPEINIDEIESVKDEVVELNQVQNIEEISSNYEIPEVSFDDEEDLKKAVDNDDENISYETQNSIEESLVKEIDLDLPNIDDLSQEQSFEEQKVEEDDDIWKF